MKHGSRSQAIRDYLAENPKAGPKQIVTDLKAKGITVTPGLASNIKYGKAAKSRRRRAPRLRVAARKTSANGLTVEQLIEAKRLADSLGGADQLRRALEALEQLQ